MFSKEIKCSVSKCKHNVEQKRCSLDVITIGDNGDGMAMRDTMCSSFEGK